MTNNTLAPTGICAANSTVLQGKLTHTVTFLGTFPSPQALGNDAFSSPGVRRIRELPGTPPKLQAHVTTPGHRRKPKVPNYLCSPVAVVADKPTLQSVDFWPAGRSHAARPASKERVLEVALNGDFLRLL